MKNEPDENLIIKLFQDAGIEPGKEDIKKIKKYYTQKGYYPKIEKVELILDEETIILTKNQIIELIEEFAVTEDPDKRQTIFTIMQIGLRGISGIIDGDAEDANVMINNFRDFKENLFKPCKYCGNDINGDDTYVKDGDTLAHEECYDENHDNKET